MSREVWDRTPSLQTAFSGEWEAAGCGRLELGVASPWVPVSWARKDRGRALSGGGC